jgi:hypothetical protein
MSLRYPLEIRTGQAGKETTTMPMITFMAYKYKLPKAKLETAKGEKEAIGDGIQLYMPSGVSESYGGEWGFESLLNFEQGLKDIGADLVGKVAAKGAEQMGGISNSVKAGFGATIIPSEFMIFKKPLPFTLALSFNFVPRNAKEGAAIVSIIQTFKKYSLPTIAEGDGQLFLSFPPVWDISLKNIKGTGHPDNPGMHTDMALTNCTVTYSGGANSALVFHDNVPVQCAMSLSFQSIKYMMRKA